MTLPTSKAKPRAKILPGWDVVLGLLVFAIMTFILVEMSERINEGPLTVADVRLSNWLHAHETPLLTGAMLFATTMGATWAVILFTSSFIVFLVLEKRYYWIAPTALSVFGGMLLNRYLKFVFVRPRPSFTDPILTLTGYSFPSGHTMAATVLFGTLAAYLFTRTSGKGRRGLIVFVAGLLIALVGFSRIYLGAHYLSDVLAAMAEGLAWVSLCLTLCHYLRKKPKPLS